MQLLDVLALDVDITCGNVVTVLEFLGVAGEIHYVAFYTPCAYLTNYLISCTCLSESWNLSIVQWWPFENQQSPLYVVK